MESQTTTLRIRTMIKRDVLKALDIERLSYSGETWTAEDFSYVLSLKTVFGKVVERGDAVLAFLIYEMLEGRYELINFAVHPSCRRKGICSSLIEHMKAKLSEDGRTKLALYVRDSNLSAQLFLRYHGFLARRVYRSFFDNGDDAYRMVYRMKQ